jgi:rSAM/selenodomain-associated transferase 1
MNRPFHIAVFAKAPIAGAVKTRLIPLLGAQGAADAQRAMTLHALKTAHAAAPGQVSLWTAGDHEHPFFVECARRFELACHPQCEGDLGQRMAHCLHTQLQTNETVLLIGTDCPARTVDHLCAAARALQGGAQMVFAPAEDGGYVLVGAQAQGGDLRAGFEQAFAEIAWSTAQVMAQTRARLTAIGWQGGREWHELPMLWDVDTPADYARAARIFLGGFEQ